MKIALLGASGNTGRPLVARLCAEGFEVAAAGRSRARLDRLDARAGRVMADLEQSESIAPALAGAECVISLAHARFTEVVLAGLPQSCRRVILTGSARVFTRLPDPAAEAVRRGAAAFAASGRPGVMLHPSMIYGAPEDRNVGRILTLIRRWPRVLPLILPLPDGGRHLVQPVFVDDVVEALVAAVRRDDALGPPIVLAGPEPISYAAMVRACAAALGRRLRVLPVPAAGLTGLVRLAGAIGLRLPVDAAEVRRAAEDKRLDVADMHRRLGVVPRPFEAGLRLKLERDAAGDG